MNKQKRNQKIKRNKQPALRKSTPFTETGGILGTKLGSFLGGNPIFKDLGRVLGKGIGSIFGSGDYTIMGEKPAYNVLSGQTPKFSTTRY